MLTKLIDFNSSGDNRGSLIALEEHVDIPFSIKRVYYIYATKEGVVRGLHAHRNLKQVAVCISGSCTFRLDNGALTEDVILDNPNKGLLIEGLVWREMYNFSPSCVLLVLASELYDEADYIRDYAVFSKLAANNRQDKTRFTKK